MARRQAQLLTGTLLDDLAEIHHRDALTDVEHSGQVVTDEQVAHAQLALEVLQQGHDLRPNGHVQRRNWLIQDDQPGRGGDGPRNGNALALTTAELVREALGVARLQAY